MTRPDVISIQEAAEILNLHPERVRQLAKEGALKVVSLEPCPGGSRKLLDRLEVTALAAARQNV